MFSVFIVYLAVSNMDVHHHLKEMINRRKLVARGIITKDILKIYFIQVSLYSCHNHLFVNIYFKRNLHAANHISLNKALESKSFCILPCLYICKIISQQTIFPPPPLWLTESKITAKYTKVVLQRCDL